MNDDIPTIEIDMQKVADNWADAECVMRREWHKNHPRRMNSILQWSIENIIAPAVFCDKKEEGTLTEEEAIWLDRYTYGCAVFMVDEHGNIRHIPFETLSEEDRRRIQTNPKSKIPNAKS